MINDCRDMYRVSTLGGFGHRSYRHLAGLWGGPAVMEMENR